MPHDVSVIEDHQRYDKKTLSPFHVKFLYKSEAWMSKRKRRKETVVLVKMMMAATSFPLVLV